jgi:hypothetical protein
LDPSLQDGDRELASRLILGGTLTGFTVKLTDIVWGELFALASVTVMVPE